MLGLPGNRVLPENYDKAEKTEKYLKTKSSKEIQRIAIFYAQKRKKRTTFMHVRDRVVDSTCSNRYLLEFTARTLRVQNFENV